MRTTRSAIALALASAAGLAVPALAGPFTAGNIVVVRVSNAGTSGSGALRLMEYTTAGADTGNFVDLPAAGASALCLPVLTNHDGHLHLSGNAQSLVLAAYAQAPDSSPAGDPSQYTAAQVNRVIAFISATGAIDQTTRLTETCDNTSIRGAFSTDGTSIWIAGDNASGATPSGGLRYTTRGASTSVDLSQVQSLGGAQAPDNIRDVGAYAGQLFDCSGSNATVGKGVFSVGTGLPTSGSQTLTSITSANTAMSTSGFAILDLDSTVPGADVLYAGTSAGGIGLHKFILTGGSWVDKGFIAFPSDVDQVSARKNANGSVTILAGNTSGVWILTDSTPLTGTLSGSAPAPSIVPTDSTFQLAGVDFAPQPATASCYANCDGSTGTPALTAADFTCFLTKFRASDSYANCDGSTGSPSLTAADFTCFLTKFRAGCP
jgi:hypothetical protein